MSAKPPFPRLDCLPAAQRALWPELGAALSSGARGGFVLYGGTALALRLGHRQSEDFDFFRAEPFDPDELRRSLPLLKGAEVEQMADNTLSVALRGSGTRLSFFGGLDMRAVFAAEQAGGGLSVASAGDVFGCKCAAVQRRAVFKDYFDIGAILEQTEHTLADGLSFAAAIYGDGFAPQLTLRALSYFDDLDQPLPEDKQQHILAAVRSVDLVKLPAAPAKGPIEPASTPAKDAAATKGRDYE